MTLWNKKTNLFLREEGYMKLFICVIMSTKNKTIDIVIVVF